MGRLAKPTHNIRQVQSGDSPSKCLLHHITCLLSWLRLPHSPQQVSIDIMGEWREKNETLRKGQRESGRISQIQTDQQIQRVRFVCEILKICSHQRRKNDRQRGSSGLQFPLIEGVACPIVLQIQLSELCLEEACNCPIMAIRDTILNKDMLACRLESSSSGFGYGSSLVEVICSSAKKKNSTDVYTCLMGGCARKHPPPQTPPQYQ